MRVNETSDEIDHVYESIGELATVGLRHLKDRLGGGSLRKEWHGVTSRAEIQALATGSSS